MSNIRSHAFVDTANALFKHIRRDGWTKQTLICNPHWVIVVGTYQYYGPANNDNEAKT